MDFKIEAQCGNCNCCFEIRSSYISDQTSLSCPCCGKEIPQEIASHILNGMSELRSVPDRLVKTSNDDFIDALDNLDSEFVFTLRAIEKHGFV